MLKPLFPPNINILGAVAYGACLCAGWNLAGFVGGVLWKLGPGMLAAALTATQAAPH